MLTAEELGASGAAIDRGRSRPARPCCERLVERAGPVLARMPPIPRWKALLTADGGVCPEDGTRLDLRPVEPGRASLPPVRKGLTAVSATIAPGRTINTSGWRSARPTSPPLRSLADRDDCRGTGQQLLQAYRLYLDFPNRDNVLGPSRLFFSTYLESIWVRIIWPQPRCCGRADGSLTRPRGGLDGGGRSREPHRRVRRRSLQPANLAQRRIGQHRGLVRGRGAGGRAIEGGPAWSRPPDAWIRAPTGCGMRGTTTISLPCGDSCWPCGGPVRLVWIFSPIRGWRTASLRRFGRPAITALPDFTFPARKDSRFGVSLAQPMYLELWEVGLARLDPAPRAGRSVELAVRSTNLRRRWHRLRFLSPRAGELPPS